MHAIPETFGTHLASKKNEEAVIKNRQTQVNNIHSIYVELLKKTLWRKIAPREESLLRVTYILFSTEGILSFGMNIVIYALILKGKRKGISLLEVWKEKTFGSFDFRSPASQACFQETKGKVDIF
jgi:hypothetical protein